MVPSDATPVSVVMDAQPALEVGNAAVYQVHALSVAQPAVDVVAAIPVRVNAFKKQAPSFRNVNPPHVCTDRHSAAQLLTVCE